jgi:hypothetical protein
MNKEKGIEDLILLGVLVIPILYFLSTWIRNLIVNLFRFGN